MSDDKARPDSQKSRQELLDEIYYLRDVAGERGRQIRRLQEEGTGAGARAIAALDGILHSRSWRLTAPLRWLASASRSGRLSAGPRRRMSERSRQELLDEIHCLRDVADNREQQIRRLQAGGAEVDESAIAELERVLHSRSWRLTAPLRWLSQMVGVARRPAPNTDTAPSRLEASTSTGGLDSRAERGNVAHALVASARETRSQGEKHLYVDVTELALHEGRTGVQRVTREILRALLASSPGGYAVRPVYAAPGQPYRLAERFAARLRGSDEGKGVDVLMDARANDVFLGLDHSMQAVVERATDLDAMHWRGVRIWFVCNDTLPLARPEWFPATVHQRFEAWLRTVAAVADGVACISRATEAGLRQRLDAWKIPRSRPLILAHFGLGADLAPPEPDAVTLTGEESALLKRLRGKPTFLTVGTLEPRKGHAQALEAFELLWQRGENIAWVIVGLPGWMTEVVQRRIRHHDEFDKRLFWFVGAGDALLERLYATCIALLAPSEGEGLGLPLIEAARHGLPILCRDLPVFREVAGRHASYFSSRDADVLAGAIGAWLESHRRRTTPTVAGMPHLTWAESTRQLLGFVLGERAATPQTGADTGATIS